MFFRSISWNIKYWRLPFLCVSALLVMPVQAQNNKQAAKVYKQYRSIRSTSDSTLTDSLSSLLKQIFIHETGPGNQSPDQKFLLNLSDDLAGLCAAQNDYKNAAAFFKKAVDLSKKLNDTFRFESAVYHFLAAYENYTDDIWSSANLDDLSEQDWLKIPQTQFSSSMSTVASRVVRKKGSDTVWFVLRGGKLNGVQENSPVSVYTTFDTFQNINRISALAGTGKIVGLKDLFSIGYVKLKDGFADTLYDRDCWIVRTAAPKMAAGSSFQSLFYNNIKIRSYDASRFYTQGWGNLLVYDSVFDAKFISSLRNELLSAERHYSKMDSGLFGAKINKGRYSGYSYRQIVHDATEAEIRTFLDFVVSYPAKYINKSGGWSFVEIYLTWILNDCPLGDNKSIVFNVLRDLDENKWRNRQGVWRSFYTDLGNTDSLFNDYITGMLSENAQAQKAQYENLLKLTGGLGLINSYDRFAYDLIWKYYELKEYGKASSLCDVLLGRKSAVNRKREVFFLKAALLNSLEEPYKAIPYFDSSLKLDPGFYYALGQKGWAMTKLMNLNEALPLCKAAFEIDSQSSWTINNYANVQFLSGNTEEALRLYKKGLETVSLETDFYSNGVMGDLNYFLKKGLQVNQIGKLKSQLNTLFISAHLHRVRADSLFKKAEFYSGRKNYNEAITFYRQSLSEEMQLPAVRWGQVRMLNRYLGYTNHKAGRYPNSLEFYQKAREISEKEELGGDALLADLNAISILYGWLNDTIRQREFEARAVALEVSIEEKRQRKRLFILLAGAETNGKNDRFAVKQLNEVDSMLRYSAASSFDTIAVKLLAAEQCTGKNLFNAIDEIAQIARESDVFVFLYAGASGSTKREDYLTLADGNLGITSLISAFDLVNAGRQIHIADCNGFDWRKHYSAENLKIITHPGRSLFFLGNKTVRIEEDNNSLLGNGLKNAHVKLTTAGEFTASTWLAETIAILKRQNQLYPFEMMGFGHDFSMGKSRQAQVRFDTTSPVIELPGAQKTRGEAIPILFNRQTIAGSITDNSSIIAATANNVKLVLSPTGRFEIPASLAQNNRITISATDEHGNSVTEIFELKRENTLDVGEGTRYAFFIASDNYQYWNKLNNPIYDAVETGKILAENYGFKVEIDSNFTQEQVLDKLEAIRRMSFRPKDQLFVYVAGHGVYDSIRQGHFVCVDSRPLEEDRFYKTYVRQKEIADMLDGTNCKNVLLLMDICYGGRMFDKQQIVSTGWLNDRYSKSVDEFIGEKLDIPCRQFLTSGGNNEVFDGDAGAHSPFCSRIMKVLDSAVDNPAIPFVTASGLMTYLRSMKTIGNDYKSYPRYGSFGGSSEGEYVFKVRKHRVMLRRSD